MHVIGDATLLAGLEVSILTSARDSGTGISLCLSEARIQFASTRQKLGQEAEIHDSSQESSLCVFSGVCTVPLDWATNFPNR
jgi:hypothetical protein